MTNETLALSLADVSCTEVWIELKTNGLTLPVNINLLKDNSLAQTISLNSSGTTIYIDSLFPNKSYQLQVQITQGLRTTSSNKLTVQTLDTTSNSFTWQTFTFGDPGTGSGVLNDVAVINENDIWAVGEFYMNDSTGQPDPTLYNAAHWNGSKWNARRLYYNYQGQNFIGRIYAVYAFNENDIWFGMGSMIHWNGSKYESISNASAFQSTVNKIWGTSSSDLYVVGNSGNIAHYNGNTWEKIESGTNNNVTDVWGNNIDAGEIIYCVTHDQYGTNNSEIISIQNNKATITPFNEDEIALSIWIPNNNIIYIGGGNGLFKRTDNNWEKINYNNSGYVGRIRGNASNDFFISGGFGLAAHFNGYYWKVYSEISLSSGNYYSFSMKDNIIAMVGYNNGKAVLTVGKR